MAGSGSTMMTRFVRSAEEIRVEKEFIRLAQAGNNEAFEWIIRRYGKKVYNLCLRMTRNKETAEDLSQESFLRLYAQIGSFRGDSAFSTWFHRLIVNVVLMWMRKKSNQAQDSLDDTKEMPDGERVNNDRDERNAVDDEHLLRTIDRIILLKAIGKLPPGYQTVFVLHDIDGYEHNEIAQIIGRSTGDSKSQLHKARRHLRKLLTDETNNTPRPRNTEEAVKQLPSEDKTILHLHDICNFNHDEVAGFLECSNAESKIKLGRARLHLRALLTRSKTGGTSPTSNREYSPTLAHAHA